MVKKLRNEYKYNDEITNIGYVIASDIDNPYPENTSIKLLVHPAVTCMLNTNDYETRKYNFNNGTDNTNGSISNDNNKGQIEGYGPPVAFTCDSMLLLNFLIY